MTAHQPIAVAWLGRPITEHDPVAAAIATDAAFRLQRVANGPALIAQVEQQAPKVIVIDIDALDGDASPVVEHVMSVHPVPILVVTETDASSAPAIALLALGALEVVRVARPEATEAQLRELRRMIRVLAPIAMVARRSPRRPAREMKGAEPNGQLPTVLAIGASTGGPPALARVLKTLPRDSSAAVLVVQHMSKEFVPGFVQWLGASVALPVAIAQDGERIRPGHVLVAPGDLHMILAADGRIALREGATRHACRPSVDVLFESVANVAGGRAIGVLLTGMGRDGAEGLLRMREQKACTIAESEASAVIYGMPAAAAEIGAAEYVMDVDDIARTLRKRVAPTDA